MLDLIKFKCIWLLLLLFWLGNENYGLSGLLMFYSFSNQKMSFSYED